MHRLRKLPVLFRVECGLDVERGHLYDVCGLTCSARACNEQWLDSAILGVESACGGADTFSKRPCERLRLTEVQYTLVLSYASPERDRVCVILRSLPERCDMLVQHSVDLLSSVLRALRVGAHHDDPHSRIRRPVSKLQTPRLLPRILEVGLRVRKLMRGELDEEKVAYAEPHPAGAVSVERSATGALSRSPVRAGDQDDELFRQVSSEEATRTVVGHKRRGLGRGDREEEHVDPLCRVRGERTD